MKSYYEDGGVVLFNADCAEVLPTIDPATVGLVLTDPPYGKGENTAYHSRGRGAHNDYAPVYGDDAPFDPAPLLRFPRLVLFGANYYASRLPDSGSWIVWDRLDGLWSSREQGFNDTTDAELAWTNLGGVVRMYRHRWTGYQRGSETGSAMHPTQKPVGLMRWIIGKWTEPGDLVLDPYMGSGPVAQACKEAGRRYIGVEIEEEYCEAAIGRLSQGVLDFGEAA